MPKVSESIDIKATAKDCYAVIWDYAKYPEFVSGVNAIKVKKKKKDQIDVEFSVSLVKDVVYWVSVHGQPHESVTWSLLEGSAFKKIEGSWELLESKKGLVTATYTLDLEFNIYVPGPILKTMIASTLSPMLKSFKKRIESQK